MKKYIIFLLLLMLSATPAFALDFWYPYKQGKPEVFKRLQQPPEELPPPGYSPWEYHPLSYQYLWTIPREGKEIAKIKNRQYKWPERWSDGHLVIFEHYFGAAHRGTWLPSIEERPFVTLLPITGAHNNATATLRWERHSYSSDSVREVRRKWAFLSDWGKYNDGSVNIKKGEFWGLTLFAYVNSDFILARQNNDNKWHAVSLGYWVSFKLDPVASKPNLRSFVTAPTHIKPGKSYTVTYRYYRENGLGEITPPFTADGYADSTKVVNTQIQLKPGESKSFNRTLTAPLNKTKVSFKSTADARKQIAETNESDNDGADTAIVDVPDLNVTSISIYPQPLTDPTTGRLILSPKVTYNITATVRLDNNPDSPVRGNVRLFIQKGPNQPWTQIGSTVQGTWHKQGDTFSYTTFYTAENSFATVIATAAMSQTVKEAPQLNLGTWQNSIDYDYNDNKRTLELYVKGPDAVQHIHFNTPWNPNYQQPGKTTKGAFTGIVGQTYATHYDGPGIPSNQRNPVPSSVELKNPYATNQQIRVYYELTISGATFTDGTNKITGNGLLKDTNNQEPNFLAIPTKQWIMPNNVVNLKLKVWLEPGFTDIAPANNEITYYIHPVQNVNVSNPNGTIFELDPIPVWKPLNLPVPTTIFQYQPVEQTVTRRVWQQKGYWIPVVQSKPIPPAKVYLSK